MTDIRYLYVTTKNHKEAQTIAEQALKERVAACANIFPETETIYWWQGSMQHATESVLILKTTVDLVEKATEVIKHWHSYSTPCILSIPIESGHPDYIAWLKGEVRQLTK
jgi:periplasmic divalent cation tolerance protein